MIEIDREIEALRLQASCARLERANEVLRLQVSCAQLECANRKLEDRLGECLNAIQECIDAYPADVFIEPPPGEHGQTVDGCSASAIRLAMRKLLARISPRCEDSRIRSINDDKADI